MHAFTICHYEPLLYVVGFFRSHWLRLKSPSTPTVVLLIRGPWRSREGAGGEGQPQSPGRGLGVRPPCAPGHGKDGETQSREGDERGAFGPAFRSRKFLPAEMGRQSIAISGHYAIIFLPTQK